MVCIKKKSFLCVCVSAGVCLHKPLSFAGIHQAASRSRPLKDSSRQPQYQLLKYSFSWESPSPPLCLILLGWKLQLDQRWKWKIETYRRSFDYYLNLNKIKCWHWINQHSYVASIWPLVHLGLSNNLRKNRRHLSGSFPKDPFTVH